MGPVTCPRGPGARGRYQGRGCMRPAGVLTLDPRLVHTATSSCTTTPLHFNYSPLLHSSRLPIFCDLRPSHNTRDGCTSEDATQTCRIYGGSATNNLLGMQYCSCQHRALFVDSENCWIRHPQDLLLKLFINASTIIICEYSYVMVVFFQSSVFCLSRSIKVWHTWQ